MFQQIKSKIGYYFLRKEFLKNHRPGNLISLSKANKIGILFDANCMMSIQHAKSLLKYFLNRSVDVNVLGFVNNRKKDNLHIATIHINYFNLNDVSLLGVPTSKKTTSFISNKYDILINLSLRDSFETKYLALLSNAKLKIGIYPKDGVLVYDLMFKLKIHSLDYFIEHLTHYLELIDNNNEK